MWRIYIIFSAFIAALSLSLNVFAEEAQTTTTTTVVKRTIITPAPQPQDATITAPSGYSNCFMVAAGWFNNLWVPEHEVCQYTSSAEGVAWVQGYWACDKYNEANNCTNWVWKAGRWVKSLEVY